MLGKNFWVGIIVQYQSRGWTSSFFFPTFRFFACLNVFFSSEFLGFFQQCKEITSLATRVMLFRDVKNLRWTKRMVGFHVVTIHGKKLKPEQRICVHHPCTGDSWSQRSLQARLLPTFSPWDKLPAGAFSGHADPLLLADIPISQKLSDLMWVQQHQSETAGSA